METELERQPHCTKIMRLDRPLNSNPGTNIVLSVTLVCLKTAWDLPADPAANKQHSQIKKSIACQQVGPMQFLGRPT